MIRLLGAGALFLLCALYGRLKTERYRGRQAALEAVIEDLNAMATDLRCERCTVRTLAARLAAHGRLQVFWDAMLSAMAAGGSCGTAWHNAENKLSMLDREETELLDTLFSKFGSGDADTELNRLVRTIERLGLIEKRIKTDYPGRIKLTNTLSMLCGAALALIIL